MAFELSGKVRATYDAKGELRSLNHIREPWSEGKIKTPQGLAAAYIREVAPLYALDKRSVANLERSTKGQHRARQGMQLRFSGEKNIQGRVVVSYEQTAHGLPVWRSGMSVVVQTRRPDGGEPAVIQSRSQVLGDLRVADTELSRAAYLPGALDERGLARALRANEAPDAKVEISGTRLLVYRYDRARRFTDFPKDKQERDVYPFPKLPGVKRGIRSGGDYIVTEVLATVDVGVRGRFNTRAFIDPQTGSVLYFRLLVASASGFVFQKDPITQGGSDMPTASTAALDAYRTSVTLLGLDTPAVGDPWELTGEYVYLGEDSDPTVAAPTEATGVFQYHATTNDFAAVNAYHHSDAMFRTVDDMGFNIATFFDGTSFPVLVDHRASVGRSCGGGNCVNASAPGNVSGTGSDGFRYALAATGTTVGIACAVRVVWHEFGHAVLWDNLHSPNFSFAHSCGDTFAAINCDPGTAAGDRFDTFPWVPISRRHDRAVASGWGWGGSNDVGSYESEQILSTSLFRAYRFTGGDDFYLNRREFAANYLTYVILSAIGGLSPVASPSVEQWVEDLETADAAHTGYTWGGITRPGGGTIHKVVRWAFEKQALFNGEPPDVDVYIDDGRAGEYEPYHQNFWNTNDVWNRNAADGGTSHDPPIVGVLNYLYVKVKNRGTQQAQNIEVKTYKCIPGAGLEFPDDWTLIGTLPAPNLAASVGTATVGPFPWTPTNIGHECLLATVSAAGATAATTDEANTESLTGTIAHWLLVPFDNNIAQRNVVPVAPLFGVADHVELIELEDYPFLVRNPFESTVGIRFQVELPPLLKRHEARAKFVSPGGAGFKMRPGQRREVGLNIELGVPLYREELEQSRKVPTVEVHVLANGVCIGGMDYEIVPPGKGLRLPSHDKAGALRKLLKIFGIDSSQLPEGRLRRRLTIELELPEDE